MTTPDETDARADLVPVGGAFGDPAPGWVRCPRVGGFVGTGDRAARGLGAPYLLPILSKAMGMGRGDGMLVVVGLNVGWLGWDSLVMATLATAVIAAAYIGVMLVGRRLRPTDLRSID